MSKKHIALASPGVGVGLGVAVVELMLFCTPNGKPHAWAHGAPNSDTLLVMGIRRC